MSAPPTIPYASPSAIHFSRIALAAGILFLGFLIAATMPAAGTILDRFIPHGSITNYAIIDLLPDLSLKCLLFPAIFLLASAQSLSPALPAGRTKTRLCLAMAAAILLINLAICTIIVLTFGRPGPTTAIFTFAIILASGLAHLLEILLTLAAARFLLHVAAGSGRLSFGIFSAVALTLCILPAACLVLLQAIRLFYFFNGLPPYLLQFFGPYESIYNIQLTVELLTWLTIALFALIITFSRRPVLQNQPPIPSPNL